MDLAVTSREITGKKVKALRREGLIPAELYGHGLKNIHLSVPTKEFAKVFKEAGKNTVVTLLVGKEKKSALIYEVSRDSVSDEVINVGFYQVRMDEKIKAMIPLEFIGDAPAFKEKAAVINKAISEIEVEAFPQDLPHSLSVDLSVLDDIDKSIYVKDLIVPKGVVVLIDSDTAIVTATPAAKEEEVVETPVDVADVKVETEEKKTERQTGKEEKAGAEDTK